MTTALPAATLQAVLEAEPSAAWSMLRDTLGTLCAGGSSPSPQAVDRASAPWDLALATAAWDLWPAFEGSVPHTANALVDWWCDRAPGRAVLVLDGLSLRELPRLLEQAKSRGWLVHRADVTGAEIPPDTTSFARALGFAQRSAVEGRTSADHRLPGAVARATGLPWRDAASLAEPAPDVLVWHSWPDDRVHTLGQPGTGLAELAAETARELASDDFWLLLATLATGRRLVVTSDHGYAASGMFPDVHDSAQADELQRLLGGSRLARVTESVPARWSPPLALQLDSAHGRHAFGLGRRKWKVRGGHPTLSHGGLTLLEVLVPFVELSAPGGR